MTVLMLFSVNAFSESTAISDTAITAKIKSKIAMDKSLSVFKVGVETNNGVVMLTGNVNSETDASTAVQIAQETDGVTDVNASKLMVKESSHPLDDVFITAKVKGMFIKEKLFGEKDVSPMSIAVETNNGTVYLSGTADSQKEIDNAIMIAKSVNGVKSVESHVEVKVQQ